MIELITNSPAVKKNLKTALSDYAKIPEKQAAVLAINQVKTDDFFKTDPDVPVVLLGTTHEDAAAEIPLPLSLKKLKETLARVILKNQNTPTFETPFFEFRGSARQLIDKKSNAIIRLTEKETALIAYLYLHRTRLVSKEQLLTFVWNYKPGTETHTVETHIYALRQKIGDTANTFLQTSPEGYRLVVSD